MEKEPLEIERKFLIAMPDAGTLERECREKWEIEQIYLTPGPAGESRRLRRSRDGGEETLYYTEKRRLTDLTRIERERVISPAEWEALSAQADGTRRPICKTRWRTPWAGHILEIDVFPFWTRQAFCEAELSSEDEILILPPWIRVLREVTADLRYTNSALALEVPPEDMATRS